MVRVGLAVVVGAALVVSLSTASLPSPRGALPTPVTPSLRPESRLLARGSQGLRGEHGGIGVGPAVAAVLRARGGGGATALDGIARFYPWSYPSVTSWAVALVKIGLDKALSMLGIPPIFAKAADPAVASGAGGGGGAGVGGAAGAQTGKKVPTARDKELKEEAERVIGKTKYHEGRVGAIKGLPVTLVANSAVFRQADIESLFAEEDPAPPKIIPECLPSLYRLAKECDLYVITQLPHAGHQNLSAYFEAHTVPSDLSPHGVWETDKQELAISKALEDAGVFAVGMDPNKAAFCETIDGRGYIARNIGEELTQLGRIALHVDDAPLSVDWLTNVCRNTTVVAIKNEENMGDFPDPKNAAPPFIVETLAGYFEASE